MTKKHEHIPYRASLNEKGIVTGYIFIFGDPKHPDCYGTYIDRNRVPDLGLLNDSDGNLAPIRLMYEHGMDTEIGTTIIGRIDKIWLDERGIAFEAQLFKDNPYYERIAAELRAGDLGISSGSAEHLSDFDEDGRFKTWLLSEVSLTARPCEPRMPAARLRSDNSTLKAAEGNQADCGCAGGAQVSTFIQQKERRTMITLGQLGLTPESTIEEMKAALEELKKSLMDEPEPEPEPEPVKEDETSEIPLEMDEEEDVEVRERPAKRAKAAKPAKAEQSEIDKLRAEIAVLRRQQMSAPASPRLQSAPRIEVREPERFARLDDHALMFAHMVLRGHGVAPSEEFRRVLGGRADSAIRKDADWTKERSLRSLPNFRANEVMISTAAGGGDEWVSIAWSSDIWAKARFNPIYDMLISKGMKEIEVPQGAESIYLLGDGSDPTVYTISQNADLATSGRPAVNVKASRPGTIRRLLTPGELGALVVYSDVFAEDSLLPVAQQLNEQTNITLIEHIERVILNGDTATGSNTNINLIDGTPGTGLDAPYYIATDGILKYALVTETAYSRDGGALSIEDYRETLKLLPRELRARRQNNAFIIDSDTHTASLAIPELATEDVRRTNATIESGVLINVYGVDVLESGQMDKANSAGKISGTPSNNTKGRIVILHAPYWAVGYKRRITIETDRDIISGTNLIVAKMRIGVQYRSSGAAAVSYNLTV